MQNTRGAESTSQSFSKCGKCSFHSGDTGLVGPGENRKTVGKLELWTVSLGALCPGGRAVLIWGLGRDATRGFHTLLPFACIGSCKPCLFLGLLGSPLLPSLCCFYPACISSHSSGDTGVLGAGLSSLSSSPALRVQGKAPPSLMYSRSLCARQSLRSEWDSTEKHSSKSL